MLLYYVLHRGTLLRVTQAGELGDGGRSFIWAFVGIVIGELCPTGLASMSEGTKLGSAKDSTSTKLENV